MATTSMPKLPKLLKRKLDKTGTTRGADDDEIYQNRVSRTSTVLIPFKFWNSQTIKLAQSNYFENGYIVLLKPKDYFSIRNPSSELKSKGLVLGENCLVFYETRDEWSKWKPAKNWHPAQERKNPLRGQYVARIPATTSEEGKKINEGYTTTSSKGAGIRLYEFAPTEVIKDCKDQLEAEFWLCHDAIDAAKKFGMSRKDAIMRKKSALQIADENGLLDYEKLLQARIINAKHETICPLCLERLSGLGFFHRLAQAEGREVPDLTVTEINLFHIQELRYGYYNHKPYNLGWGHHHCNVVVKDSGIMQTLQWMKGVIIRNEEMGINIPV